MEWDYWCSLMAELFASNQLGVVPEDNWRDWADGITGIGYFTQSGVPDSRLFDEWKDWAFALTNTMKLVRRQ
jgi:hypothetical protein